MDEIAAAILQLTRAFKRNGLAAPVSIEIGATRDVQALRALSPRDSPHAFVPTMTSGRPEIVTEICGVEVRGPAQWRVYQDGVLAE